MGSYPLNQYNYSSYDYKYPAAASDGQSAESSGSLLSGQTKTFSDMPLIGAQDNRVISNKSIEKNLQANLKAAEPQKKGFFQKVGDFFKGIGNGIKNIVSGLLNPKNWPIIIGAVALCIFCPPAGMVLAGVGALMAGSQIIKGVKDDNWEKVGEGALNFGLSAAGFRASTASVKTGDAKYTLSGTRTAEANVKVAKAEEQLLTLKNNKADIGEIRKAEGALAEAQAGQKAALDHQARIAAARQNFLSKGKFMDRNGFHNMSAEQIKVKAAQSADDMSAARGQFTQAEQALDKAKASGKPGAITEARTTYDAARQHLTQSTLTHLDVLKAQRIKELQGMGFGQRTKTYAQDSLAITRDSFGTAGGKTLTSVDGRTVSYWNRTPKTADGVTTGAASESVLGKFKSWWTPNRIVKDPVTAEPKKNGLPTPTGGGPVDPDSGNQVAGYPPPQGNPSGGQDAARIAASQWRQWRESPEIRTLLDGDLYNPYTGMLAVNMSNGITKPGDNQFNFEAPA